MRVKVEGLEIVYEQYAEVFTGRKGKPSAEVNSFV